MPTSVQCVTCQHYLAGRLCKSFMPNEIPEEILLGEFDHSQPHPGDNGLRWEPVDAEAAKLADATPATGEPQDERQPVDQD